MEDFNFKCVTTIEIIEQLLRVVTKRVEYTSSEVETKGVLVQLLG